MRALMIMTALSVCVASDAVAQSVLARVPGIVEAEQFDDGGAHVAYLDTTPGNIGGYYRDGDVDIAPTADQGGGFNVGWMSAGEWLAYTVDISAAADYTLVARVASSGRGGGFHVEVDGVDVSGPLVIPNTFGWQQWTDVLRTVTLPAGVHVLRVVLDSNGASGPVGNFNYLRFTTGEQLPYIGGAPIVVPGHDRGREVRRGRPRSGVRRLDR